MTRKQVIMQIEYAIDMTEWAPPCALAKLLGNNDCDYELCVCYSDNKVCSLLEYYDLGLR